MLDAVTKQLGTTFGLDYRYYVENVEQGLQKPCFTIDALLPTERSKSPILYDRTIPIVVHYFSDSNTNLKKDCYEMAERTLECLEYIPYEKTILRGEDISWQIVDDVLQIFITYRFTTVMSKATADNMEEILETTVRHT
jgi:hypothetical protein